MTSESGGAITEADVAAQVADWFAQAWDPEVSLIQWRTRLLESGWAVPSWSTRWYGKGLPAWADRVAHATILEAGGVALPLGAAASLAAPTLYDHASDELKAKYLGLCLTGELLFCQLFSEPGAGSDLAGLKTTAVRDGDEWIVNGQKVWNTSAHHADMGILVARSDWDAVKHAGLTFFLIDMRQPGVEVRPIDQMNYHNSFNEVFLTDARIAGENVVGEVGGGWAVARGTLAHERGFARRADVSFDPAARGRVLTEARAEMDEWRKTYVWYPQRQGRPDLLIERAKTMGVQDDPLVRQKVAEVFSLSMAAEWTAARARAARELGRPPGSEGSIGKLAMSEIARRSNAAHTLIAGASAMLRDAGEPVHSTIAEVLVSTPAQSIAGGTDEIQRNILGENVLGLPKEPAVDRGIRFRDVASRG